MPAFTIASDGTMHALWWDAILGEQYAHTTSPIDTTWFKPVTVPFIVGSRQTDTLTGKETITPPRQVYLKPASAGRLFALWFDANSQLTFARLEGTKINPSTTLTLTDTAVAMDAVSDVSGTLHLTYIQSSDQAGSPAGIYYRTRNDTAWSKPVLIYASTYFRTSTPAGVHLRLAGNNSGRWIVAWAESRIGPAYAYSTDGGVSWRAAHAITATQGGLVAQPVVGLAPNGEFLLLWQDTNAGGCGLTQRRSSDGGATWTPPVLVLTDLTNCPSQLALTTGGDGRLWLVGTPASTDTQNSTGATTDQFTGLLAAWDGKNWSTPLDVSLSPGGTAQQFSASLGCLMPAFGGNIVAILGCDAQGDLWVARNAAPIDQLLQQNRPAWDAPVVLSQVDVNSGQNAILAPQSLPAITADSQGNVYAMWSQANSVNSPGVALYAAVWNSGRWSRGSRVLQSPAPAAASQGAAAPVLKSEQPALAVDTQGRLHAVWSGGDNGQIYYSWALVRDATSAQGWAAPKALTSTLPAGDSPDILADPRGPALYVLYAVPFNEKRGVWFLRSDDGGATWSSPTPVFDAAGAGWQGVAKAHLAFDARANVLHAVWLQTPLPGGTSPYALYYARSTDGGRTWSPPFKVADGVKELPHVAVPAAGQVYILWQQTGRVVQTASTTPFTLWGRFSPDGGQRWAEADQVPGFEQISGAASLVADGAGRQYLVAFTAGTNGASDLLFSQWDGQAWTTPEDISTGQPMLAGNSLVAALAASPSGARLEAVAQMWSLASDGSRQFGIAGLGRNITGTLSIQPAPTFTPMPTMTPQPTATALPTSTPLPVVAVRSPPESSFARFSDLTSVAWAGALALVIVLASAILAVLFQRRRHR